MFIDSVLWCRACSVVRIKTYDGYFFFVNAIHTWPTISLSCVFLISRSGRAGMRRLHGTQRFRLVKQIAIGSTIF